MASLGTRPTAHVPRVVSWEHMGCELSEEDLEAAAVLTSVYAELIDDRSSRDRAKKIVQ
jgi:hypothetical protein